MIDRARHDFVELSYIYGAAIVCVLVLSSIAAPIDLSKAGLIVPLHKEEVSFYNKDAFTNLSIRAKAYIVYDVVTKEIVASKNQDAPLPIASITKVMTGLTALTHGDKAMRVTITPEDIEGGYDLGLVKGQVWTLGELLKYTLVFSSNDGAYAIAEALGGTKEFVEKMNTDSALMDIGLTFTDPAGLDIGDQIGGAGTVLQVAKLFDIARRKYPELLDATTKTRVTVTANKDKLTGIPNTNQEIHHLFGAEASKTGFTDSAGGNLGVIVDVTLGHPVIIVVLGSTRDERFSDTETLYKALIRSVQ